MNGKKLFVVCRELSKRSKVFPTFSLAQPTLFLLSPLLSLCLSYFLPPRSMTLLLSSLLSRCLSYFFPTSVNVFIPFFSANVCLTFPPPQPMSFLLSPHLSQCLFDFLPFSAYVFLTSSHPQPMSFLFTPLLTNAYILRC